jgi:hypothetical protein
VLPCVDVFVADRFFVWAPILRMLLVLRLGAHFADASLVAFGRPNWVRPYEKVYLQAKICSYPSSSSSFSLVLPCVDVFIADLFCVWETILRKCLALRWGTQLADVRTCLVLRMCLALQIGFSFGHPCCGRALHCVWAPLLRTHLSLRCGAQPW